LLPARAKMTPSTVIIQLIGPTTNPA